VTVTLNFLTMSNGYSASGFGGAILSLGNLTINNCKLVNNQCGGTAGALTAAFGSLTMSNTTVAGNVCDNCSAIYIQDQPATLVGCTVSGNSGYNGDALRLQAANVNTTLMLVNSTFAGNVITNGVGAAISIASPTGLSASVYMTNCTVASNLVLQAGQPGAIWLQPAAGSNTLALYNSIVAGNTSGGVPGDITGSVNTGSAFNLVGVGGGLVNGVNDNQVGVNNPKIAALGNYGGLTPTMPPLAGSAAIDAGGNTFASGLTTDQRGFPRLVGPQVDIGAVEFQPSPVVVTNDSGPGSLRYAVAYSATGSVVNFATNLSGNTILLTSGEMAVANSLTVDASALPAGIRVDGNHNSRIFNLGGSASLVLKSMTLTNCFPGAGNWGGAITSGGTLALNNCTLAGNSVDSSSAGGAIENGGPLSISGCTFAGNSAGYAGAIDNRSTCTLQNSTFFGNVASPANGGAIDNVFSATLSLLHCTFYGNSAVGTGGAIDNYLSLVNVTNSIIAGDAGSDIYNWSGSVVICGGTNIIPVIANGGGLNGAGSILTSAPVLAALGNYGGLTPTMPPLFGSPAINAGSDAAAGGLATDQRGYPRPSGPHVDIGAVEAQIATQAAVLKNVSLSANGQFKFSFTNLIGGSFTVLASTNVAAPLNTWSNVGPVIELPPGSGQFQFTDSQAANFLRRFYRVHSP
jgi:hypothetical protein